MARNVMDYLKNGEGEHHGFGPSNFPAWSYCTHYKGTPVPEDDLENKANRGTLQHICLEDMFTGKGVDPIIVDVLTEEESEGLEWAYNWVSDNTPSPRLCERKISMVDDDFELLYFGTIDLTWIDTDSVLHIMDYKTGNKRDYLAQLMGYALPCMIEYKVDKCIVHTCYTKFQTVEEVELTLAECRETVLGLLDDVKSGSIDPQPCDYCSWCSKASTCSALTDGAIKVVQGYVDSPFELAEYHSSQITDPNQMYKALWIASKLEGWCKSVKKHAKDMSIEMGMPIPNTKICNRKGKETITDVNKALEMSGMTEYEFMSACSVSLDKLADVEAKSMKITKVQAKKDVVERLSSVIVTGKPTKYIQLVKEK